MNRHRTHGVYLQTLPCTKALRMRNADGSQEDLHPHKSSFIFAHPSINPFDEFGKGDYVAWQFMRVSLPPKKFNTASIT